MVKINGTQYEVPDTQVQNARAFADRVRRLRETGTLSPAVLAKLRRFFKVKNIHHSNAIEGNSLSVGETRMVVEEGLTLTGKPLKDQAEAKNLSEAIDFLEDLARSSEQPITENDVRQLHQFVLKGIDDEEAGRYRRVEVQISGTEFRPPGPEAVPGEMGHFGAWLQAASVPNRLVGQEDALLIAAAAHTWFVTIHPFVDGNGRVSRLLMNLLLMRYGFPIAVITLDDRIRYYDALEASHSVEPPVELDMVGADGAIGPQFDPILTAPLTTPSRDLGAFVELLTECLGESLEEYEAAAHEQRETIEWARSLGSKFDERENIRAANQYEVWKSAMDLLKSQFRQTAELLSAATSASRVYFKDFGDLEFEKYRSLKAQGSAKRTWFFRLDFRSGAQAARYLFFFGWRSETLRGEREADVTLHVARENPAGSHQYSRCDSFPSATDPDTVELAYSPSKEKFLARTRRGSVREEKVDTIVRDIVQQVVERNFTS